MRRRPRYHRNHHLWLNTGVYWLSYCVQQDRPFKSRRVRLSLRTKSVTEASRLRDRVLGSPSDKQPGK